MKKWAKTLTSLVRSWWHVDQIRVSPVEGRLLRLQPPCYLRINTETIELVQRRRAVQRLGVIYDCADGSELQVILFSLNQALKVYWQRPGGAIELAAQEVEVFSAER